MRSGLRVRQWQLGRGVHVLRGQPVGVDGLHSRVHPLQAPVILLLYVLGSIPGAGKDAAGQDI